MKYIQNHFLLVLLTFAVGLVMTAGQPIITMVPQETKFDEVCPASNNEDKVQAAQILAQGVNINTQDRHSVIPLEYAAHPCESNQQFIVRAMNSCIFKGRTVYLHQHMQRIGQISYVKIPCTNWNMIFDFYVEPEHRNNGNGTQIFTKALEEITKDGIEKLMIQPAPYEIVNGTVVRYHGTEHAEKTQRLMNFYRKYGFEVANNACFLRMVRAAYFMGRIDDDARLCMVKISL